VFQNVGDLRCLQSWIDGDSDQAGTEGREHEHNQLDGILAVDRDAIAWPKPTVEQPLGRAVDGLNQFFVGECGLASDQGRLRWYQSRVLLQQLRKHGAHSRHNEAGGQ